MSAPFKLDVVPDRQRLGKWCVVLAGEGMQMPLTPGLHRRDAEKSAVGFAMAMNVAVALGIGEEVGRRDGAEAGKAAMDARLKLAEEAMGVRP